MPDPLFQKLFDETAQTRWQPVAGLRDRARRRERRRRIGLVAAAAVAVLAASAGIAVAQLDRTPPAPGVSPTALPPTPRPSTPPPSPPPSATTPPAGVPLGDALFLRPADVGPGYRLAGGSGSGDWTFEFSASTLGCRPAARPVRPLESAERALIRGAPQADDRVSESVSRFRAGDASRYLAGVRARVDACAPGGGQQVSIAARDFAGQEALLVAVDYGGGFRTHHVLVRQGDLLAEFFVKPSLGRPALQGLGRTAAARLCPGTDAC